MSGVNSFSLSPTAVSGPNGQVWCLHLGAIKSSFHSLGDSLIKGWAGAMVHLLECKHEDLEFGFTRTDADSWALWPMVITQACTSPALHPQACLFDLVSWDQTQLFMFTRQALC